MTSKTSLRLMALCAVLAAAAPLAACDNSSSGTTPDRTYPQDRATTAPGTTSTPATPSNGGH
jgi:hypothetical protein